MPTLTTDDGIKLRWELWHRTGLQYFSYQGGDEIVLAGKTIITVYSSTIDDDKQFVGFPDGHPTRHPAAQFYRTFFSARPGADMYRSSPHPPCSAVAHPPECCIYPRTIAELASQQLR